MGLPAKNLRSEPSTLLSRINELPPLPMIAHQVTELINSPASTRDQVGDLLRKDQALTAKVLRLANSSYYSIPGGVKDVSKALSYLGFNTIAQLVLSLSVVSMFKQNDRTSLQYKEFWRHALATAIAAEAISKQAAYSKPEEVFTCALLHDIGKLALIELEPDYFNEIFSQAKTQKKSFIEIELAMEMPSHAKIGAMLAKHWGLPKLVVDVIENHHDTHLESISLYVSQANEVSHYFQIGESGNFEKIHSLQSNLGELDLENLIANGIEQAGVFLNAAGE